MKKNIKWILAAVIFVVYSVALYKFSSNPTSMISTKTNDAHLARFIENYNILKQDWYYFGGEKKVIDAATNAMTSSNEKNDVYSEYIPPDKSVEHFKGMESQYIGIGIQYVMAGEYPLISTVFNNSPAAKVKMLPGDTIIKVGSKSTKKLKTEQVKKIVQGKDGNKRKITIIRNNKEIVLDLVLKSIDSSVHYQMIDDKGYLELTEFTKTSTEEVQQALEFFKSKNAKKVVIDLRNNPGGDLTALQGIADLFLKEGKIIIKTKDNKDNVQSIKTVDNSVYENEYIMLSNENSASASEALIACLNENLEIPIYGKKTFGKGIMQKYLDYPDNGYLKYTNAEWLTPKGNAINKKGIKPTKEVKDSAIFETYKLTYDFKKDVKNDTVSNDLVSFQKALNALKYPVDRVDGYYSKKTQESLIKFKKDNGLSSEKDLSIKVKAKIIEKIFIEQDKRDNDNVLNEALK